MLHVETAKKRTMEVRSGQARSYYSYPEGKHSRYVGSILRRRCPGWWRPCSISVAIAWAVWRSSITGVAQAFRISATNPSLDEADDDSIIVSLETRTDRSEAHFLQTTTYHTSVYVARMRARSRLVATSIRCDWESLKSWWFVYVHLGSSINALRIFWMGFFLLGLLQRVSNFRLQFRLRGLATVSTCVTESSKSAKHLVLINSRVMSFTFISFVFFRLVGHATLKYLW